MDKRRILIADDNADDLSVLEKALEQAGYEVITAHDGRDAFRLATGKQT